MASSLVLVLTSLAVSCLANANVGRTPGTFQVSPEGAATYTIPIWAPKGPNGLEPQIALTYSSQGGKGYLGVGWEISGLSTISRCNKTFAQDGSAAAPIELVTADGYCLDGQRLRLTAGTYGTASSTYATEIDNFEKVTAYGAAGNGPAHFEVKDRNGVTYEYGNGGSSQVLARGTSTAWQWWLDKITDTAGNTLAIQYTTQNATGTVVPELISWTPTSYGATSYSYTMTFSYGTNTAQGSPYGYVAGTVVSNTNLLNSISIAYGTTLVKEYFLSYQTSTNTNKKELSEVQECADAAKSNCLSPTTISYYQDSQGNGVSSGSTTVNFGGTVNWYLTGYDVNGDGYRDLLYQVATTWYVAFGNATGYGSPINTGINTPQYAAGQPTLLPGDLLGNGKDGLLANNGGTWYYYTWNGSSFSGTSTGVAYNASASAFALADTTGDGKPNLIELIVGASNVADVYIVPNTSSGSTLTFGAAMLAYSNTSGAGMVFDGAGLRSADSQHDAPIRHLDFDGDGTDDLVLHLRFTDLEDLNGKTLHIPVNISYQLLSHGTSFTGVNFAYNVSYYFLNWNDSKCTDSIYGATLSVAACNGNAAATYTLPGNAVAAMDWDGSGRDDVLYASGSYLYVQPTTGTGLGTPYSTGIAYDSAAVYASADINSDGLDDLLTSTGSAITVNMHTGQGEPLDTLSQVKDGYGNTIAPQYVPLTLGANSTYAPGSLLQVCAVGSRTDCSKPYLDTLYVASKVIYSDPSNPPSGTYTRTHHYSQAMESLDGRGFVGFATHSATDSRNNLTEQQDFSQAFPYIFMPTADIITDNATGKAVTSTANTPAETEISTTTNQQVWFPYISASTKYDYEVRGSENGDLITTTASSFTYDNYGTLTSSSQTVTDEDPGSPYYSSSWKTSISNTADEDPATWCLPLLSQTTVTYSDTYDNTSIVRTRQFTPDLTHCRYTELVTAPNTFYQVTEGLAYDNFGNIDSDTVTGTGMTPRVTTANWTTGTSTTGQFPMSVTNPAGELTQFNYDFRYGLVSSETNPNNLTTSWAYADGFGRLTKETRPDGTYTIWSYTAYSGSDPKLRMHIIEAPYDSAGNVISETAEFLDMEDRLASEDKTLLDGSLATVVNRAYDSLGRLTVDEVPYEGSEVAGIDYAYDELNRVTAIDHPTSQSDSSPATTTYDYAGRTTTITDANGHTRTLIRDVNGWLRASKDDLGYEVIFGYDAAGSRTSVTDSQAHTLWRGTWAYGIAPFLTSETSIDSGAWGFTPDALGERTAWTDPKGQQFSEMYDALSRPVKRFERDLYTQWTWGSTPSAHNVDKLWAVCTGTGTNPTSCSPGESEAWSYDADGRLYQRAITLPGMSTYTYTWQYSQTTGFLQNLTYPTGSSGKALTLQYGYANGYLQTVTDTLDSPNIVIWTANTMNPAGQITQDSLGNHIVTTRAYDAVTHLLTSVQSGVNGASAIQNMGFLYDPVGNVLERQDNNLGLTENFYYDGDDRLSYSTLNGTQNLYMYYDANGDIASRTDVANNASWTYDPNHIHQVTEAGSAAYQYAYDANGNMDSRAGSSISWTSYNYPSEINDSSTGETEFFSYGPDRKPWIETTQEPSGTTYTYRIGGLMDIVAAPAATSDRDYAYAGNEPIAVISPQTGTNASVFNYFLTDQQGSISAIAGGSGHVAVNESFSAYGARRDPSAWSGSPSSSDLTTISGITQYGYTFQRALGATMGLNDMVGRIEDAVIGRFISPDPYVTDPENTQDWNPYSYVYNNPLTYVDPSGFACGVSQTGDDVTVTMCGKRPPPDTGGGIGGASNSTDTNDPGGQGLINRLNNLANRYDTQGPDYPTVPSPIQVTIASSSILPTSMLVSMSLQQISVTNVGLDPAIGQAIAQSQQKGKKQQTKPPTQSKVCQYASSDPDASELAAVATTLGIDDNLVQAIEKADPSFSLPGFLGEAAPTMLSGAATGIAGGIIAGEVRQGEYLNATLDSMDMGLGLAASKGGGSLLLADTAFNALGGFKQLAKGAANVICTVTGGN